jgi:tetratricopeptide (TPR) repeat protein
MKSILFAIILFIIIFDLLGPSSCDSCKNALNLLETKPRANTDFANSLLLGCNCLQNKKDYSNAKRCYNLVNACCELVLKNDESDIDATSLQTDVILGLKDVDNEIYAPASYSDSSCLDIDDFSPIIHQYDIAIENDPNNTRAWNDRGILLARVCDFNGSLTSFEEAIRSNSTIAEAWYNKGVLLYRESPSDALRCLDQSIKLNRNLSEAWFNRYGLLMPNQIDMSNSAIKKAYEEARRSKDQAISLNPDFGNRRPPYLIFIRI